MSLHVLTFMDNPLVIFQPSGTRIFSEKGYTVLDAAQIAGIQLPTLCGGKGVCGKCKVRILRLRKYAKEEKTLLTEEEIKNGIHLACQVIVKNDMVIEIPSRPFSGEKLTLVEGFRREVKIDPNVRKIFLKLPHPTLEDNRADTERMKGSLQKITVETMALEALQKIPGVLRGSHFEATFVFVGNELIGCEKGDTTKRKYGAAFDIGTSTVVGYLLDLTTGECLAVSTRMNPQAIFGEDVVSRIAYGQTKEGLKTLSTVIRDCLADIIDELSRAACVNCEEIYELSVAGNTCMHHLFLGISPQSLAISPHVPVVKEALSVRSNLYGKKMYVLPIIAGFIGGDAVADLIAHPFDDEIRLLIDIGTNCEVILGTEDRMMACSAAAGPAFEGFHITCGMRALPGAIKRVTIDDSIAIETIGGVPPCGISGSGLISIAAEMVRWGFVDPSGRLQHSTSMVKDDKFMLTDTVYVTQKDLRELQLAKGALFAAQRILLKAYKADITDVKEIILAGAFGSHLSTESAKTIGLLFDVPTEKIKSVGNAAGVGAQLCLLSRRERERARALSERVEYVELSLRKDFQQEFIDAMRFPHADLALFPSVTKTLAETSPYFTSPLKE